jgi:Flp pilus assembly protein TadB
MLRGSVMDVRKKQDPEIVTYRIPRIEVYQVTDDELTRIEEASGHVDQDFTFAVAFLSFAIAFAITLVTATLSDLIRSIFILVIIICTIVFLYTGTRWWRTRKSAPKVIASIRSRKENPEVPS